MENRIESIMFDITESIKDLGHEIRLIQEKCREIEEKITGKEKKQNIS